MKHLLTTFQYKSYLSFINAYYFFNFRKSSLPYTHISSPKPYQYKLSRNFPRGVANRRAALSWLRENVREGILYFGDDDNTVDLQLFDEIRVTKKVSMFPVGLIGGYGVSSPVVKDGKVFMITTLLIFNVLCH